MNTANLKDMVKGWFVGGFTPTAFSTQACEVAVKPYAAGDAEAAHYHKIATEVTLILSGEVEMWQDLGRRRHRRARTRRHHGLQGTQRCSDRCGQGARRVE